jgi:long-chain fatty acid transport protein
VYWFFGLRSQKYQKGIAMMTPRKVLVTGLLLLSLPAQSLLAAGFNIYEQSAKASGMAGAWVAQADDAAANWYNPAALVWLEGSEFQIGTNFILPDTEFTSNDSRFGILTETTFEMDNSLPTPPSHIFYRRKLNPNIAFGVGITTPYGLATEWVDRPVTFSSGKSELATIFLNPNVAVRLTRSLSLGVGVSYVTADLKDFSREVPIDLDGDPSNGFEVIGTSNLSGTGEDLGWNVALHHKGAGYSFGLTYRSAITVDIEGDLALTNFGPLEPFFVGSPASAPLKLPDTAAIGLAWLSPRSGWNFEVDVTWSGWSEFDSLDVDLANNVPGFVEDISLREDWNDTMSYRFGAWKQTARGNTWRFGFVFDEQTVPGETLRASIPDADRYGPTFGYSWNGKKMSADLYYFPLFTSDSIAVGTEDGVIEGEFSSTAHLVGITLRLPF